MFMALMLALSLLSEDPVMTAIEKFKGIETYRLTFRSKSKTYTEELRYYYKKPGYIRMEFIKPYRGAILVYTPEKKKVVVRPFGFLKPFTLKLKPDNALIKSGGGHRIDESDLGSLLNVIQKLSRRGEMKNLRIEKAGEIEMLVVSVKGSNGYSMDRVNHFLLWFEKESALPVKIKTYDVEGELLEEVLMDKIEIDVEFPENFFNLN